MRSMDQFVPPTFLGWPFVKKHIGQRCFFDPQKCMFKLGLALYDLLQKLVESQSLTKRDEHPNLWTQVMFFFFFFLYTLDQFISCIQFEPWCLVFIFIELLKNHNNTELKMYLFTCTHSFTSFEIEIYDFFFSLQTLNLAAVKTLRRASMRNMARWDKDLPL